MRLVLLHTIWTSKTTTEKEKIFARFLKNRNLNTKMIQSSDGKLTVPNVKRLARKPGQRHRNNDSWMRTLTIKSIKYFQTRPFLKWDWYYYWVSINTAKDLFCAQRSTKDHKAHFNQHKNDPVVGRETDSTQCETFGS
jgi:hypothetical protein